MDALEDRIQFLTERLERAQTLAYTNGQAAANEGSRLYEMDPETRRQHDLIDFLENVPFSDRPAGTIGQDRVNRWNLMTEFERNAVRYESEARSIEWQLGTIEQELEALR